MATFFCPTCCDTQKVDHETGDHEVYFAACEACTCAECGERLPSLYAPCASCRAEATEADDRPDFPDHLAVEPSAR